MGFDQINLGTPLRNAIEDLGLENPTPIQTEAFPVILSGRDVIGIAQTGTGKTYGYLMPILKSLAFSKQKHPRVLIIVPTRELVLQVEKSIEELTPYINVRYGGIYGGANINKQKEMIRLGLDILVSTPGRIIDLGMSGALKLKSIQKLVLDEVDEILALGFRSQLEQILDLVPNKKQGILFSATMTPEVELMIEDHFRSPVRVEVEGSGAPLQQIKQVKYEVPNFHTKVHLLEELLKNPEMKRVLVFLKTKRWADLLFEEIAEDVRGEENTSDFAIIHSNKTQNYRLRSIKRFQENRHRVLIATDLVARGLDFEDVTHVINFDIPETTENYLHRIGRTARANKEGVAISFVSEKEMENMASIEEYLKRPPVLEPNPEDLQIDTRLIDDELDKEDFKPYQKLKSKQHAPGPAFHEKKEKNQKTNQGGSYRRKLAAKYKKPKTRGQKRK
ncbi:MAG: DEAD/DEAH box helicase [Flavobacteriaceae bacterium]